MPFQKLPARTARLFQDFIFLKINAVIYMKKFLAALMCLLLCIPITGCSSKTSSIEVADDVTFSLVDVLEVDNNSSNTAYYYFLASLDNNSESDYHMSNLNYILTTTPKDDSPMAINPIDQYKTVITNDVCPGQSTFVYGYIGIPQSSSRDLGLYVSAQKTFLPFDSIKVRKIQDDNVVNSTESAFTIYEDSDFEFDVDATNLTYSYENGTSRITGLIINYTNKTDQRLVVPFLTPVCTIDGLKLDDLPNGDALKSMSLEEISKQDFSTQGMDAKTEAVKCKTLGYQLFYLTPNQTIPVEVSFEAEGVIPDFSSANRMGITININSPSLGYSQIMKVNY